MNAFLTGSYRYGTPHEKSDIDICILTDRKTLRTLREFSEGCGESGDDSLKFGRLNIIHLSEVDFRAWKAGTEALEAEKPVTRARAIEVMTKAVNEARSLDPVA